MSLQLDDLQLLESAATAAETGQPLLLPIGAIDEDPAQPRREFDEATLQELAATIAERGVRQPISVRNHPELAGRWLLNFGARRLRASKLAGKTDIPAFIDESADSYDQVIENEQREALKPLELAMFIQRRMVAGETKTEIARRLGKSQAYVTMATALVDAPDWLLGVYRDGRCRGMTELYELRRLHDSEPHRVEDLVAGVERITRERIGSVRGRHAATSTETGREVTEGTSPDAWASSDAASIRSPSRCLEVDLDGTTLQLVLDRMPETPGEVFVRRRDGTGVCAILASRLKLLGFAGR